MPRGLHNLGTSTSCHLLTLFWYSKVGWASTDPQLKAAEGPPHVFNPALLLAIAFDTFSVGLGSAIGRLLVMRWVDVQSA